jgi:uncharacterized surface protein with fasciclin (FAS1) repeats
LCFWHSSQCPRGPNIVETTLAANAEGDYAGTFDTLIAALQAEGRLINQLSRRGQYTVFAPTDDAFASLLTELNLTAEELLGNPELLQDVLSYHVTRGRRDAEAVTSLTRLRMLNWDRVHVDGTTLTDENGREANIIVTDIKTSNGIIHVIDRVILPQ